MIFTSKIKYTFSFLVLQCLIQFSGAQSTALQRMDSVDITENSSVLKNEFVGGFNFPQFSPMKLDGDGIVDLMVFDRGGEIFLPFLNPGNASGDDFVFAPEYAEGFPKGLHNFVLLRDFNCDGLNDIFTGSDNQGIDVWENTSSGGITSFDLVYSNLITTFGLGPVAIFVNIGDIPAIDDIDNDGDLDILSFESGGIHVNWHKNLAIENGNCDTLIFEVADPCWGKIEESGSTNLMSLNISCKGITNDPGISKGSRHSGSTITTFDQNGDGDKEILVGDLVYSDLVYLRNAGSAAAALMDTVDYHFPFYDSEVAIDRFPVAFTYDVENDGLMDILVSPNAGPASMNYSNSWYYRNVGTSSNNIFQLERSNFIQNGMVDLGSGAFPALFDFNNDSLMDLVVGNHFFKADSVNRKVQVRLYENIGTATHPAFNLVTRNYANLQDAFIPSKESLAPAFGDLDGDGDMDMLVGDLEGKLHFLQNTAPIGNTASFAAPVLNYSNIDVGDNSIPFLVDLDRDGDLDILVGEAWGNIDYFQNTGTASAPVFSNVPTTTMLGGIDVEPPLCCSGYSAPVVFENSQGDYELLVGTSSGALFHYTNVEGNLSGNFTLADSAFGNIHEGLRTATAAGDLNADGILDYVVGNMRGGSSIYNGNTTVVISNPMRKAKVEARLFPNPSNGECRINVMENHAGLREVKVFSSNSEFQFSMPCHGNEVLIENKGLSAGIYFVRISLSDETVIWLRWAVL